MSFDPKTSLTAERIASNLASFEAARSGFFTFIVDNLDGITKANFSGNGEPAEADRIANAQEYLALNVVKTSVPHFTIQPLMYQRGNEVIKMAGKPEWGDDSITVDDVVGLDTKSILMAWQNLAYNVNTRKGGRMKNYKKTCTLCEYTQDYEMVRSWTLYGCWISALQEGDFDKENDGKRQVTATIQYDRAIMNIENDNVAGKEDY